jgi:hypothetical protein
VIAALILGAAALALYAAAEGGGIRLGGLPGGAWIAGLGAGLGVGARAEADPLIVIGG